MAAQGIVEAFKEKAHRQTVETNIVAIAHFLSENFGQTLVAYMAGVSDPKTVGRWANGEQHPRLSAEARLRTAYQVFQLLQSVDSPHTVRAWFIGLNPQLNDQSPAKAIREDMHRQVLVAAKTFTSGG